MMPENWRLVAVVHANCASSFCLCGTCHADDMRMGGGATRAARTGTRGCARCDLRGPSGVSSLGSPGVGTSVSGGIFSCLLSQAVPS